MAPAVPAAPTSRPSASALLTTRTGHLALALLAVELLAGMQTYLNQTVLPLVATDLNARDHYGLVTGAAMFPTFVTMPLGGAMLSRWRAERLMTALTGVLVAGAVLGALAPDIWVYVAGEVLRGLAAGALATMSMGVIIAGLPDAWRRLFLAAGSAMWIVSSLLGPAYAAGVADAWGWRWALVGYVPVLVAARLIMAREIRGLTVSDDGARPPVVPALVLACGVAVIATAPAGAWWLPIAGAVGLGLTAWSCARVFPAGAMRLQPGRPTAVIALAWMCAAYFSFDYLIAPAAHDVLGLEPAAIGAALTVAGLMWSLVAVYCGSHPAREPGVYRRRTAAGGVLFAVGSALVAGAMGGIGPWWWLHAGWAVAGAAMGLSYQDTILRALTPPVELGLPDDGIGDARAATAVTVAGSAGAASLGTLATSLVAPTRAGVEAWIVIPVVLVLGTALALTPFVARRAA